MSAIINGMLLATTEPLTIAWTSSASVRLRLLGIEEPAETLSVIEETIVRCKTFIWQVGA